MIPRPVARGASWRPILRLAPRPLAVGSLRIPPHGRTQRDHGLCPWGSMSGASFTNRIGTAEASRRAHQPERAGLGLPMAGPRQGVG